MNVTLETKCGATHMWTLVACFELSTPALEAARALSLFDGCAHRVIDNRWPDEAPIVSVFEKGVLVA